MADVIIIAGAPGSGKHTVTALLRDKIGFPPHVDLGRIREFHLDREWKLAHEKEEAMSFGVLEFMVRQYLRNGYRNVLVTDLQDFRVQQLSQVLKGTDYRIITLVLDDAELEKRIRMRGQGFTNVEAALAWNRSIRERKTVENEYKVDNTHHTPHQTVESILELLKAHS